MSDQNDHAEFTFSWLALKLLGRGLYSNPWSALSELVANGLDAGAGVVYVFVDARNKADAVVEIIDDGRGMSRADIDTYVQVGHDKRKQAQHAGLESASNIKGRKGIGKLAALFLSRHFVLSTRHSSGETAWELDARDDRVADDDNPSLLSIRGHRSTINDSLWGRLATGTRLTLYNVDLTGYGSQATAALGSRLANQFLLPTSGDPAVKLWVRTTSAQSEPSYEPVRKSIAFGNFAELAQRFVDKSAQPPELAIPPNPVLIPVKELPGGIYEHLPQRTSFPPDPPEDEAWDEIKEHIDRSNRTYRGVPYSLEGWIGAHATILSEAAKANDERFVKNKYYNPAQIRVYVRGKLANEHLLGQLGLTGTYVNYIEGEVSFDLLDDDSLPDIATSNRQDFDETDHRVTLLKALVRPIVRSLIQRRNNLATTTGELARREKERRSAAGKRQFSNQVRRDLEQHPEISDAARDDLQMVITNKIGGDVEPKQDFRVFISHARADVAFASLIDEVLRSRGARDEEVFFTSRQGSVTAELDERALSMVIKESITNANTLIFYMTSHNFLNSQFCLFEGGAGWATRSVSEYLKLNVDYESIPKFLTNGKAEVTLLSAGAIELTPSLHNYLIRGVLNPMIDHLNRGRDIAGEQAIKAFEIRAVPTKVELLRAKQTPADYFDPMIKEYWQLIVDAAVPAYLASYSADGPTSD